ncbi:MAG: Hsp20/alpha crystallin family protein [Alphaproteobacteria bacterium]|nr:Hsp20/alpha crystallin family protein [Alphaproteobacteria bacterium]
MKNAITHTAGNNSREISSHGTAHSEFKNFLANFWNLVDFPHHKLEETEPKIEVSENKDAVTISAELPGVKENDIDVQISSDGYLTISAEKRSETEKKEKNNYFSEIYYGSVQRTVPLPWDLDFQKADADYNDGILKIAIPKTQIEKSKVKKISVKKAKKQ